MLGPGVPDPPRELVADPKSESRHRLATRARVALGLEAARRLTLWEDYRAFRIAITDALLSRNSVGRHAAAR